MINLYFVVTACGGNYNEYPLDFECVQKIRVFEVQVKKMKCGGRVKGEVKILGKLLPTLYLVQDLYLFFDLINRKYVELYYLRRRP